MMKTFINIGVDRNSLNIIISDRKLNYFPLRSGYTLSSLKFSIALDVVHKPIRQEKERKKGIYIRKT